MVAIIGIRCGALRARSGLSTRRSISRPTRPREREREQRWRPTAASRSCVMAVQRRVGAHHEDGALREVDDAQHAEDQREAEREEGVDAAERQGVEELLFEHGNLVRKEAARSTRSWSCEDVRPRERGPASLLLDLVVLAARGADDRRPGWRRSRPACRPCRSTRRNANGAGRAGPLDRRQRGLHAPRDPWPRSPLSLTFFIASAAMCIAS